MSTIIIIPARYGSSRFPGKPLAQVSGHTVIYRVWLIAKSVQRVDGVYVATDDERIATHVQAFGGQSLLTSDDCKNGTERVFRGALQLPALPRNVINLQGDAVLTPPWVVQKLVDELAEPQDFDLVTPAVRLSKQAYEALCRAKASGEVSGTTVVLDNHKNALYFSKSIIPFLRGNHDFPLVYRHIGLYGYHIEALERLVKLGPSPLEQVEQLEQLRALENGLRVRVVVVDYRGRTHMSIDSPADIGRVEDIIVTEGELITNHR